MKKIPLASVDEKYIRHLRSLFYWLLDEIEQSGGDGDATLVLKNYDIAEFKELVVMWAGYEGMSDWLFTEIRDGRHFAFYRDQEALIVTTNSEDVPSWSQCTVYV